MNKELIKKYKAEFDHWLNGGKVLSKYTLLPEWNDCQDEDIWRIPSKNITKVLVVIDDEYVEFRKAMAEGKIVEYLDFRKEWRNLKENCRRLEGVSLKNLRIKPERHKFKTGDWVIHNGKYKRVTKAIDGYIDSLDNEVAVIMKEESLELWEPKEEEYFWYKNDLVKFDEIKTNCGTLLNSVRGCSYYTAEANYKEYCEPFVGQLPTNIREYKKG